MDRSLVRTKQDGSVSPSGWAGFSAYNDCHDAIRDTHASALEGLRQSGRNRPCAAPTSGHALGQAELGLSFLEMSRSVSGQYLSANEGANGVPIEGDAAASAAVVGAVMDRSATNRSRNW